MTELTRTIQMKVQSVHEDLAVKAMDMQRPSNPDLSFIEFVENLELETGLEYCRFFFNLFVGLGSTLEEVQKALTQEGIPLVVNEEN